MLLSLHLSGMGIISSFAFVPYNSCRDVKLLDSFCTIDLTITDTQFAWEVGEEERGCALCILIECIRLNDWEKGDLWWYNEEH